MRLVDTEDVIDALGNMEEPIDLKEAEEWIDTVPTAMQLWTSVKNSQPSENGVYFVVYDFWYWQNCIRTMQFKDGKWGDDEYPVKFWMPIPRIPKEDE